MAEISRARWTPMDTCMSLNCSIKIKRRQLHVDSLTHDNMAKSGRSDEDLTAMT